MPAIIFLIIMIALIVAAANWMDAHPGSLQLLLFALYVGAAVIIYRMFGKSRWLRNYKATQEPLKQERLRKRRERALAREWEQADFKLPTPEEFRAELEKRSLTSLHHAFRLNVLYYQADIYRWSGILNKKISVEHTKRLYGILLDACVQGLNNLSLALPHLREEMGYSPFTVERPFTPDEIAPAYRELAVPLDNAELKKYLFQYQDFTFEPPPGSPGKLLDRYKSFLHEDDPPSPEKIKRQWEKETKDYDKQVEKMQAMLLPMQLAVQGTPYWRYADRLLPREEIREPFIFPWDTRFAGTWIVAPPGRGKTNLLHNLISEDRRQGTVVLMDSKGDLINAYRGLPGVVVIEPRTANINPLQLGSSTRSVEFLEYIFSALLETGMTPLQKTLFRSVLTLLLKVPNATLETFRQVLTVGWKPLNLEPYIRECDPATQDFFLEGKKPEFDSNTYSETKQQILWRLRLILSNEYLRAIFTSPTTNVPFNELLDSRKTIIIDNSKDDLGEEGAEFFGRFFIALVWMAAVSRSRLRPDEKVPVYVYIDECHTVIKRDTKVTTILDECRSQKIALVLAHQRIAQINPEVIDALNNCAIRLANSDDDAEALAKRFRLEAAALRLPIGQFACFVRDKTPQAVTINVPPFDMSQFPPPPSHSPHKPAPPAPEPPTVRVPPRAVPTNEVEDF
jgi:hypothetical protein